MQNNQSIILKDLVLVGGGHSHIDVLRRFGMKPMPGIRLTLISRDINTPYSGMLPGLIAGHYGFDDAHIDLEALSRFAGARFYHDSATGIDLVNGLVHCRNLPPIRYGVLSINIGSEPRTSDVPGATGNVVPVKPISRFIENWESLCKRVLARNGRVRIGVVGTGAGGVEILLAMQFRLRELLTAAGRTDDNLEYFLFGNADEILPGHNAATRRVFERVLLERRVWVLLGHAIVEAFPGYLRRANSEEYALDEILWVTNAGAASWLGESGLRLDPQGFIEVDETLQCVSHPGVFAAGDIASVVQHPRPKAGVFAVRQGPPLTQNLRLALLGEPLRPFRAQSRFLSLITTGDKYAVASRGTWAYESRLIWRWKDWIDRRFVRKYNGVPHRETPLSPRLS